MQLLSAVPAVMNVVSQASAFAYFSICAIRDPTDAAAVSAVGELSSLEALEQMKRAMMATRTGRMILKNQPLVTDDVLTRASAMPAGSFGKAYASFMNYNHFAPHGRTDVKYIADPTLRYVMTRYRQCHDFLHACLGCGRTVEEELAVKLVEWQHTGLPIGLLAVLGGAPYLTAVQRARLAQYYWPWAKENAPRSVHGEKEVRMYLTVPWETMLHEPMDRVLHYTGLTPLATFVAREERRRQRAEKQLGGNATKSV